MSSVQLHTSAPLLPSFPFLAPFEASLTPSPTPLFLQAYTRHAAGDFASAIALYSQLTSAEAILNLGVCYLRTGRIAQARRLYALSPVSTPEITFNYAISTLLVGKRREAITALQSCLRVATQESLKTAAERVLSALEKDKPSKAKTVLWRTEPDFNFSMVVKSEPKRTLTSKARSLSSLSGPQYRQYHLQTVTLSHSIKRAQLSQSTVFRKRDYSQSKVGVKSHLSRSTTADISLASRSALNVFSMCDLESKIDFNPEKTRQHGSLMEEDLEDQLITQQVTDMGRELHSAVAQLDRQLNYLREKPVLAEKLNMPRGKELREEEIERVREEMGKPHTVRDLSVLVAILTRIKFFEKFKADVRRELLRVGGLQSVPRSHFVFYQGDASTHVYVILKGSISVWRHSSECGSEPLIVNTLYIGDSFGDLSLFTDKANKDVGRTASCQAVEDTDLYYLAKDEYQRIMIREVEISLQSKLSFLLKLPFFAGINEFVLVPLAATLTPIKFKIGQYVLHSGEVPKGLHIIVSGRCNICSEGYSLTPKSKHATRSAQYGVGWTVVAETERKDRCEGRLTRSLVMGDPQLQSELKAFFKVDSLDGLLADYVIYRERVTEDVLPAGSFFAGRCLVVSSAAKVTPSKFSILADSAETVVYVVTTGQVPLLGEKLASYMTKILAKCDDPDCPMDVSRDNVRKEFIRWHNYKGKTILGTLHRSRR